MKENLKELLDQLPESDLRALVQSVYGMDKQVDKSIEAGLLASDGTALAKHLKKQVQSLNRGSRFISYRESSPFSVTLYQLLKQIETLVPHDPKAAFELTDLFMATHKKVYNRCDDSGGCVGDSYRDAMRLWLDSAVAWKVSIQPCKHDWTAEVLKRHGDNDYAVWDYLISGSLALVGEQPLRELASQFEADAKNLSAVEKEGYNRELSRATLGLRAVAEALGDVAMYERSYTVDRPDPNELQKKDIAKFCLAQKDAESALKWLAGEWPSRFSRRQQALMDDAYVMLGRSDDLLAVRRVAYSAEPSFECLQALLEVVPDAEKETLQAEAVNRASSSKDIIVAVEALMKLQAMEAVTAYVLQHPERLRDVTYYSLADWAGIFESASQNLAAVLVYRMLLLEILQEGRYKAYRHAAKYYKALARLDVKITDYQTLINKVEFDSELRASHGQKRSFWALVT